MVISLEEIIKAISGNPSVANRCRVLDINSVDGIGLNKLGTIEYWKNGKFHRDDGPAKVFSNGDKHWYKDGKHHREDGPSIEYTNGYKAWYKDGQYHREDGPAEEYINEYKNWWINGLLHREDGPAIEYPNGDKYWYLNGKEYSREDFEKLSSSRVNITKHKNSKR